MDGAVPSAGTMSHDIDNTVILKIVFNFRAVFSSKAETEEHVGVSHVVGNLS